MISLLHSHTATRKLYAWLIAMFVYNVAPAQSTQQVIFRFDHIAGGKNITAANQVFMSPANEPYSISKLKYYISNIGLGKRTDNVFLIDAFANDSIILNVAAGTYHAITFLMGVDSVHNCSGAQDGALDPLNDMFWTWNNGYVTFKLEGSSDSSSADLHRIEQHIGGYKFPDASMRLISLPLKEPLVVSAKAVNIVISCNLDRYWQSVHGFSIVEQPVLVVPGPMAALHADNFTAMFSIEKVEQPQ